MHIIFICIYDCIFLPFYLQCVCKSVLYDVSIFEIQHAICITDVLRILHRCIHFASIILGPLGFLQTGETIVPFGRFSFGMFIVLVAWFPTGRRRVFSLGLPVYWENTWMTYQERPSTGVVSQSYSVFFWTFDFVSFFLVLDETQVHTESIRGGLQSRIT